MKILPVSSEILKYLTRRNLKKKFEKQIQLLQNDLKHPSLNVELLEPHNLQLFSFRVDRKYRVIFFFNENKNAIQILRVTDHYQK